MFIDSKLIPKRCDPQHSYSTIQYPALRCISYQSCPCAGFLETQLCTIKWNVTSYWVVHSREGLRVPWIRGSKLLQSLDSWLDRATNPCQLSPYWPITWRVSVYITLNDFLLNKLISCDMISSTTVQVQKNIIHIEPPVAIWSLITCEWRQNSPSKGL